VSARSGPGWIEVAFTPSTGATPSGYALEATPADGTPEPAQVPATGPFLFQVNGGSCATQYTFRVIALFPTGQVASRPTGPVRPCLVPNAPQNLRATPIEHAADLTWTAPSSTSGAPVTYDISWSGATSGSMPATGTSAHVTGLVDFKQYRFDVAAVDGAGASASATASISLDGPRLAVHVYNNSLFTLSVRAGPTTQSSAIATIPVGQQPPVTVVCQVAGEFVTDPHDPTLKGDIWDQVVWNGRTAYISDLYLTTPQSSAGHYGSYSDPPLWRCT
jgi:hypothetical protein